jgi:hypothetical protein
MTVSAETLLSQWADLAATYEPPPPRVLDLPSAEAGLAYGWRWWADTVPGLLSRHRLLPARAMRYATTFTLTASLRERFGELFDLRHGPQGVDYPFLYAQGLVELMQSRLWADLGVNRRHLTQLRHRTRLPAGIAAFVSASTQHIECGLRRLVRVSPTEVLVLFDTRISSEYDTTLALVEDGFMVTELQPAQVARAEEDDLVRRSVSRLRRRSPEIDPCADDVRMRQLYIAPDAGRRFARVSGERSPAHRGVLGARLMGQDRPHVQVMYLRNLISRELAEWSLDQSGLQINFVSEAFPGQTLRLLQQGDLFELVDEGGRLLAFGKV